MEYFVEGACGVGDFSISKGFIYQWFYQGMKNIIW